MKKIAILFLFAFTSNFFAQSWTQQQLPIAPGNIQCIYAVNNNICWAAGMSNTCLRTTNGGINWYDVHGNLTNYMGSYTIFALNENYAWMGTGDGSIYRTTNGGNFWILSIPTPYTVFIDGIYMYNSLTGFAIGDPSNLQWMFYITTNGGATWTLGNNAPNAANDIEAGWTGAFCTTDTAHIWWGTNNSKIFKGSLRGPFSYSVTPALNQYGIAMQSISNGIAICNNSSNSVQNERTTNGGLNWFSMSYIPSGLANGIKCAPTVGSYEYWIAGATGILFSTDNGVTWTSQVSGVNFSCISMVNVQCGWAGGTSVVYKYSSQHPVGIPVDPNIIPKSYSLSQNYPNPFNPETTIEFSTPPRPSLYESFDSKSRGPKGRESGVVTLKIFDVLGREVATLVNGNLNPGNYEVKWDATGFSSGIYFYTLSAGDFKETRKMIITK